MVIRLEAGEGIITHKALQRFGSSIDESQAISLTALEVERGYWCVGRASELRARSRSWRCCCRCSQGEYFSGDCGRGFEAAASTTDVGTLKLANVSWQWSRPGRSQIRRTECTRLSGSMLEGAQLVILVTGEVTCCCCRCSQGEYFSGDCG